MLWLRVPCVFRLLLLTLAGYDPKHVIGAVYSSPYHPGQMLIPGLSAALLYDHWSISNSDGRWFASVLCALCSNEGVLRSDLSELISPRTCRCERWRLMSWQMCWWCAHVGSAGSAPLGFMCLLCFPCQWFRSDGYSGLTSTLSVVFRLHTAPAVNPWGFWDVSASLSAL